MIAPTFNVLIATTGRPTLQNMLNSLSPQLSKDDCLTVVFDGKSEIPSEFNFSRFNCEVKLFCEPTALGYWGHGIRNKYSNLLEKRHFVMHADDDDKYLENIFTVIRNDICNNIENLYMYKFIVNNTIFPEVLQCIENSVGTPCGIIPYELNKKGIWLNRYGGDGAFYEQIARQASNIVYHNKPIYVVRPSM